jgi:hypothetical protein
MNARREPAAPQSEELAKQVAALSAAVTRQAAHIEGLATKAIDPAGAPAAAALQADNQKLRALNAEITSERDRLWQALSVSMSNAPRKIETPKPAKVRRWWQFWEAGDAAPESGEPRPANGSTSAGIDKDFGDLEQLNVELAQVLRSLQNMALQSVFLGNDDAAADLLEDAAGLCHRALTRLDRKSVV